MPAPETMIVASAKWRWRRETDCCLPPEWVISLTAIQAFLKILQITLNERLSELDKGSLAYSGKAAVNHKRLLLVPPLPFKVCVTDAGRLPVRIAQITFIWNPAGPVHPRLLPRPCNA